MMNWIKRLLDRFWRRQQPPPAAAAPIARPGHNKPPSTSIRWIDNSGAHYRLRDLLENLPEYFEDLKKLRSCDPDVYDLYRHIGGVLLPEQAAVMQLLELPSNWTDGSERPATGMIHFRRMKDEHKNCYPGFGFWQKVQAKCHVEKPRAGEEMYRVVMYLRLHRKEPTAELDKASRWFRKKGYTYAICEFYVAVDAAGKVRALRERQTRHRWMRNGRFMRLRMWHYAWVLRDSFKHRKDRWDEIAKSVHDIALHFFCLLVSGVEHAASGVQVLARKDGLVARFDIDMLRTPYFFKEREKVKTESGKTKPIFHIVRAHPRMLAGGQRYVRSHFRGVRRFNWQGYRVTVSMPGWHHNPIGTFSGAAFEWDSVEQPKEATAKADEVGRRLYEHLQAEWKRGRAEQPRPRRQAA